MLHPRSELQIFAVLNRLCEVVRSAPPSCTMCGQEKQRLLSCAACMFNPPSLCALDLWRHGLVPDVPGFSKMVCFSGHDKARGALYSALPEVMTRAVSHSTGLADAHPFPVHSRTSADALMTCA